MPWGREEVRREVEEKKNTFFCYEIYPTHTLGARANFSPSPIFRMHLQKYRYMPTCCSSRAEAKDVAADHCKVAATTERSEKMKWNGMIEQHIVAAAARAILP